MLAGLGLLGAVYYFQHRSSSPNRAILPHKSDCNTTHQIGGWPNPNNAKYIKPSGKVTDGNSCATACSDASFDVQASLFYNGECKCYKNWTSSTACVDEPWKSMGATPVLYTAAPDTLCTPTSPLKNCSALPNPWVTVSDAYRGLNTPKLTSTQTSPDACSRWCQSQPDAAYFNFNKNQCYCGTNSEVSDPNLLSNCVVNKNKPDEDWSTGPGKPDVECPSRLINVSRCHTKTDFTGWPDNNIAHAVTPDAANEPAQCAKNCEDKSNDVEAAMFDASSQKCMCYTHWASDSACYDASTLFDDDSNVTLLTADPNTLFCTPEKPFTSCSAIGDCKNTCVQDQGSTDWSCQSGERNCASGYVGTETYTGDTGNCNPSDKDPCPCTCLKPPGTCTATCKSGFLGASYCGVNQRMCADGFKAVPHGDSVFCSPSQCTCSCVKI